MSCPQKWRIVPARTSESSLLKDRLSPVLSPSFYETTMNQHRTSSERSNSLGFVSLISALICLLFAVSTSLATAQEIKVTLSETELSKTVSALVESRGINFGARSQPVAGLNKYYVNVSQASINLVPTDPFPVHVQFTADAYARVGVELPPNTGVSLRAGVRGTVVGTVKGIIDATSDGSGGYKLRFRGGDFQVNSVSTNLPSALEDLTLAVCGAVLGSECLQGSSELITGLFTSMEFDAPVPLLRNVSNFFDAGVQPSISTTSSAVIARLRVLKPGVLPSVIASDFTLPPNTVWTVEDNVRIISGATLRIESGVRVQLKMSKGITVENGRILTYGTSSRPIYFEREPQGSRWSSIRLEDGGNRFNHTVFQGGYYTIDVRSRDNRFNYVTARNNFYGLYSYSRPTGGRSSFTINRSSFLDNIAALMINHADVDMQRSTVRGSERQGIYAYNSDLSPFRYNLITDNGDDEYDDGIFISTSSELRIANGYNTIADNRRHQIYVNSSGRVFAGKRVCINPPPPPPSCGDNRFLCPVLEPLAFSSVNDDVSTNSTCSGDYGYNVLSEGNSGGGYIIYNTSSYTVDAEKNYWGRSTPSSSDFSGSVDYSPYLSSAPSGAPSGAPSTSMMQLPTPYTSSKMSQRVSSDLRDEGYATDVDAATSDPTPELKSYIQRSREALEKYADQPVGALIAADLYQASRMDRADKLGEWHTSEQLLRTYRDRLIASVKSQHNGTTSTHPSAAYGTHLSAETGMRAMLIDVDHALQGGKYESALRLIKEYDPYLVTPGARSEALHLKIAALEALNRPAEALDAFGELKATTERAELEDPSLASIEERLYRELDNATLAATHMEAGAARARHTAANLESKREEISTLPERINATEVYPNPVSARAFVQVSLPETANVRIDAYDILGRRVADLMNVEMKAGVQVVPIETSNLASGTYFLRFHIQGNSGDQQQMSKKFVVVR